MYIILFYIDLESIQCTVMLHSHIKLDDSLGQFLVTIKCVVEWGRAAFMLLTSCTHVVFVVE